MDGLGQNAYHMTVHGNSFNPETLDVEVKLREATAALYVHCPTKLSVQVSSALAVRLYARVRQSLTGLFPNAASALAGGVRGRNRAIKASRQMSSASSAAIPRARVP
jgi:hypothetical protein